MLQLVAVLGIEIFIVRGTVTDPSCSEAEHVTNDRMNYHKPGTIQYKYNTSSWLPSAVLTFTS